MPMQGTSTKQTNALGLTKSVSRNKTLFVKADAINHQPDVVELSTADLIHRAEAPFKFKPLGPSRQFGINE
jgi:hypothetical protein